MWTKVRDPRIAHPKSNFGSLSAREDRLASVTIIIQKTPRDGLAHRDTGRIQEGSPISSKLQITKNMYRELDNAGMILKISHVKYVMVAETSVQLLIVSLNFDTFYSFWFLFSARKTYKLSL